MCTCAPTFRKQDDVQIRISAERKAPNLKMAAHWLTYVGLTAVSAINLALTWTLTGYYRVKPILQKTLLDLLSSDLAKTFAVFFNCGIVVNLLHFAAEAGHGVPDALVLTLSWITHNFLQLFVMHLSFIAIVRYLYVVNVLIIWEGVTDETIHTGIRAFSGCFSTTICITLHVFGMRPLQYQRFSQVADPAVLFNAHFVILVLGLLTLIINMTVRYLLSKHNQGILLVHNHVLQQQEAEPEASEDGRKRLVIFLVVSGITMIVGCAFIMVRSSLESSHIVSLVFAFLLGNVVPICGLAWKDGMRKHARSVLASAFEAFRNLLTCTICRNNAVHPALEFD